MNVCAAGHGIHQTKRVEAKIRDLTFPMVVFDYDQYKGFAGYCTGQDDISQTIINTGMWEQAETPHALDVYEQGDRKNLVLDFGAHIGWFSILAGLHGYKVRGFEADVENIRLLTQNAKLNKVDHLVDVAHCWVDETMAVIDIKDTVEFLKIDLEGNDFYAVKACAKLFQQRKIKNALIEISPVFNAEYPDMVGFILGCGYRAFYADATGREWDGIYTEPQFNLMFVRVLR